MKQIFIYIWVYVYWDKTEILFIKRNQRGCPLLDANKYIYMLQ